MNGTENLPVQIGFAILQELINLFHRHQQGENVSTDLVVLQSKVRTLLASEQAIAKGEVAQVTEVDSKKN